MGAKKLIRGLAMSAIIAAAATVAIKMKDEKNRKKAKELGKTAVAIKERVVKHAAKLGKLSKSAYGNIVDTTVGEYRGVKALSEGELDELKAELKAGWEDVQQIFKPTPKGKSGR
ncbi:MAG: hypothetical protein WCT10_04100 [Patescibacteria group bacterium]|jgi:hypothetical protein